MEAVEVSAKTVEEAIEMALSKLGLKREEVEVEVLQESKSETAETGDEEAKVRVTPLEPGEEIEEVNLAALTKEVVEKLLFLMKIPATVQVSEQKGESPPIKVNIEGEREELGLLIGRRGNTLSTFQYTVNFILSRKLKSAVRVAIDVAGYRERRRKELEDLALRVAELVKSSRRSITLEPLPARDRRIIHLALREQPGIVTKSIEAGENRRVVISPQWERAEVEE